MTNYINAKRSSEVSSLQCSSSSLSLVVKSSRLINNPVLESVNMTKVNSNKREIILSKKNSQSIGNLAFTKREEEPTHLPNNKAELNEQSELKLKINKLVHVIQY